MDKLERVFENIIFASRWVQTPLYAGLIVAALLYCYKFVVELARLVATVHQISETALLVGILTLVDVNMVVNLIIVVVIGGYATFVSKLDVGSHPDRPAWLERVDPGTIKIKLATSLVGVSGVHLLKVFMNIEQAPFEQVMLQATIHVLFLVTAVALAVVEKISHKCS